MQFLRLSAPIALLTASLATSSAALANEQLYNQVSLRAEAYQEVAHDQMEVTLYTEEQNTDPAQLATQITKTLNSAVKSARQQPQINVRMGNRRSYPVHDEKDKKIIAWRERAEIRLESTDFSALSALTGKLLQSLKMANMQFSIAPKTRTNSEDALLKEAIDAFQARAQLVTEAFGSKDYKVVNLNLSSSGFARPPIYARSNKMMMAMSDESAVTPEVEAGSSQVSIIADGVIEIAQP
ncbi:SIMPL domain-containing protein [Denitrificimonas sp. JX-1]|uniref:SIMPL domain-containing protein n=1 Tax=Denitrificimonas halotolerans TaxID=3098930 RepID=A0ABU5GS24_9GAMM|nr:SIMPL domain-containing protein [Denitrificimonas sp. JX-1]MDY7219787.1 SIMPL domain-containing protein [Denitrificimonas sp. JX-1]